MFQYAYYFRNSLSLVLIQTKHPHIFNIRLNLPYQARYIGKLDTAGEGTFSTKRKDKHLFRKTNSLGINLDLLTNENLKFKWISIDFNKKKLTTSRTYYLTHSNIFNFAGFEKQSFLCLDEFGYEKAKKFEDSLGKQGDLFSEVA